MPLRTTCHAVPRDVTLGHRGTQQALWEAGSVVTRGVRCPLVPTGGYGWLVCVVLQPGRELKPATGSEQAPPGPRDRTALLSGDFI